MEVFTVSGTHLIINSSPDFETKSSYNIYINVNDGVNNFAKAFTVSVTNINEAPNDIGFLLNQGATIPTNGFDFYIWMPQIQIHTLEVEILGWI